MQFLVFCAAVVRAEHKHARASRLAGRWLLVEKAGAVRQLDVSITASRKLDFFAYELKGDVDASFKTQTQAAEALTKVRTCAPDSAASSASRRVGSMRESRIVRHQPGYREAMGRVFNLMAQSWALRGIRDTQCGFKCFRREAAHDVFSRQTLSGFCFDVESLYIASRLGYRIKEVPVTWANSPETKVRALRDSTRMFMDLLKIRARHRGLTRAIRR